MPRRPSHPVRRFHVELLESRALLASFAVTSTADSGAGTLRQAILQADADTANTSITFAIPGGGLQTITPATPLPAITRPVLVDGTSQPGYDPAQGPRIAIDGSQVPAGAAGLELTGGSTVRGLLVLGFKGSGPATSIGGAGILLSGSVGGDRIEGSYVGISSDGVTPRSNNNGIEVHSPNNTIGGTAGVARNVISGNFGAGVYLVGTGATGNVIEGNFVGTDTTGRFPVQNRYGIDLGLAANTSQDIIGRTTIGGTAQGAGNLISGNNVGIQGSLTDSLIAGNTIGLDFAGTKAVSNGTGIQITATRTTIGGTTAAARNVISGNFRPPSPGPGFGSIGRFPSGSGIELSGDSDLIQGNYIGPDVTGKALVAIPLGTGNFAGILLRSQNVTNITIGGTATGAGNVISGNQTTGLELAAGGNLVQGNFIGTSAGGSSPLPNGGTGIVDIVYFGSRTPIPTSVPPDTIGGTAAGAGNIIAFNGSGLDVSADNSAQNATINVRGNKFFGNGGSGFTFNRLNSFITSATPVGTMLAITGELIARPSTTYLVDVYANPTPDPSGFGEGLAFLGTLTTTTDAAGFATYSGTVPGAPFMSPVLSTTITDSAGASSGFSQDFPALASAATLDLAIAGSASPSSVTLNNDVTYTFTVTNNGSTTVQFPNFTAALPSSLTNVVAFTTGIPGTMRPSGNGEGSISVGANGLVTGTLDFLLPGQSNTVTIIATATQAGPVAVLAGVSDRPEDPNYANNETTQTVNVGPPGPASVAADLAITQTTQLNPTFSDGPANFALTVTNKGPTDATNVVVRDNLVASHNAFGFFSLALSGVTPSQGSVVSTAGDGNSGFLFVINLGTIPAGKSATIFIAATDITPTDIQSAGFVTNTAKVSGDQFDPSAADKTVVQSVPVTPPPYDRTKLTITEADSPSAPTVGGNLTYTLTVAYSGAMGQASFLNVGDILPQGVTLVSATSSQGVNPRVDEASRTVFFALNPIAPGAPATLTLVVKPTRAGVISNTANLYGNDLTHPITSITQNQTVRDSGGGSGGSGGGTTPTPVLRQPPANFDGSGRSNLAVYLPAYAAFAYRPTGGGPDVIVPFGIPGPGQTIPAPGDYSGSGRTEIAAYLPAFGLYAIRPGGGGADVIVPFGIPGPGQTIPTPGDFEGSGRDNLAVYLPAYAAFAIRPTGGGPDVITPFGIPGPGQSIPVPGDYFGTGRSDLAVYLPAFGAFAIRNPAGGPDQIIPFGQPGAGNSIPVPGDYDGSGRTELAVYFPALGVFAYRPANGGPDVLTAFGAAGDGSIPVPGDYSGSGHTEIAVFDPNFAAFAYRPATGPDVIATFGAAGPGQSVPVAAPAFLAEQAGGGPRVVAQAIPSVVPSTSIGSAVPGGPTSTARRARLRPVAQPSPDLLRPWA